METRSTSRRCASMSAIGLAVVTMLGSGCGGSSTDSSPVVAKVGNEVLTTAQLDAMLHGSVTDEPTPAARWNAVDRWVNRELLYREAVKRGIEKNPDVQFQVKTAEREIVINALLEDVFRNELNVTDDEIKKYYNDRRTLFRRQETTIHVRQIVVNTAYEARTLIGELQKNPDQFAAVARAKSIDPSATEGGDIGYVSAESAYSPGLWAAIQRLQDGEITPTPIRSDDGYHVLQVVDRRPAGSIKSLDEVRVDIINRLRTAKRLALMTELVERQKLDESYSINEALLGPRQPAVPSVPIGTAADSLEEPPPQSSGSVGEP